MIVLYREIIMLWLSAGYGETGAGATNSAKFRGGGVAGVDKILTNGGGEEGNNYLIFKR